MSIQNSNNEIIYLRLFSIIIMWTEICNIFEHLNLNMKMVLPSIIRFHLHRNWKSRDTGVWKSEITAAYFAPKSYLALDMNIYLQQNLMIYLDVR